MRTVFLLAAACNTPAPAPAPGAAPIPGHIDAPGETVLTVNGTPVGLDELELVFKRMKVPDDQLADYAWTRHGKDVAEGYAMGTVLYEKAIQDKLYEDPEVQMQLASAERQILYSAERDKLAKASVTDEAVQKYYDENKDRYDKPEVRASQILVPDEATAKDVLARIQKGEDFETLARQVSTDPASKRRGGDVGWFHQQENPLWGDAAFAAQKGQLIGPIHTRMGWHLVVVTDKRDSTPLEDVRAEAAEQIQHQQVVALMDQLRKDAKIEWVKQPEADPAGDANGAGVAVPGEGQPRAGGGN